MRPSSPDEDFKERDSNRDGYLELEEFLQFADPAEQPRESAIFKLCDRDADAKLTLDEFKNQPPEAGFRRMDSDGDGMLSFRDFYVAELGFLSTSRAREVFKHVDRNGDGVLNLDEFVDRPKEAWFAQFDENRDGKLSLAEYSLWDLSPNGLAMAKQTFPQKDLDHDGKLSLAEFHAAKRKPAR